MIEDQASPQFEDEQLKSLAALRAMNRKERRRIGLALGVRILGTALPLHLQK